MKSGFCTWKDVLDVVIIPIVLGAIALLWPAIQSCYRRRNFLVLIRRELEELDPFPELGTKLESWTAHQQRAFIHQKLFEEATENRDFILSLPEELVYQASQLWKARAEPNADQWLYFLDELASSTYITSRKLRRANYKWKVLMVKQYGDSMSKENLEKVRAEVSNGAMSI